MASRSWEKAHSPYWSLHVEAWHQSGMDRTVYCRQHGLSIKTFGRWMKHLISKEEARKHAEYLLELRREERRQQREKNGKRRQKRRYAVSTDIRSRAIQAFWAMHVEAMNWSGMAVREYAASLQLSPTSLRKWRDRLDDGTLEIDWRAHLHPSARPRISTGANGSAKDGSIKNALTTALTADLSPPDRKPRRVFTEEEKLAIVLETEKPGATVSQVARDHRIVTSMLFRWRASLGFGKGKPARLAAVKMADGQCGTVVLPDLLRPADGMTAVELGDGRRVFAPEGSDPETVRRHVADRETAR